MKSAVADIGVSILMIAIASFFLFEALQLPPSLNPMDIGAAALPLLIIGGMIICSLFILIQAIRGRKQQEGEKIMIVRGKMIIASIVILIVYALLIPILGYYIPTALAVIALLLCANQKSWMKLVFVTGGFLLFAWIGFEKILNVPLP